MTEQKWDDVADGVIAAIEARVAVSVRKAAEEIYGDVLTSTTDYLADNAKFNIASTISSHERERNSAVALMREVAECLRTVKDYVTDAIKAEEDSDPQQPDLLKMMREDLSRINAAMAKASPF